MDAKPCFDLFSTPSRSRWGRSLLVAALSMIGASCADPGPIVLTPLPPGVAPVARSMLGAPRGGVAPAVVHARLVCGDAVARGAAGAELAARRQQARLRAVAAREEAAERRAAVASPEATPDGASSPPVGGRAVDPNTASAGELQALTGIGPALAARIIEGRPYATIDGLLDVRGIGPRTLDRIRSDLRIAPLHSHP